MPKALDAAHLGLLDLDAGQLRADPCAQGTFMPAATFGAPQTICSGAASPTSTEQSLSLSASGCFLDAQHVGHDDAGELGRDGFVLLDLEAGHGQQVAQLCASRAGIARGCAARIRKIA
jgi:hypothetical protein